MQWAKVREYIKNPYKVVNYLGARGRLNFLPDELYLKLKYYACLGKTLTWPTPRPIMKKSNG
jgi:hypothetical protein